MESRSRSSYLDESWTEPQHVIPRQHHEFPQEQCAFRRNPSDGCAKVLFLLRTMEHYFLSGTKNPDTECTCPMLKCRKLFPNASLMVGHVKECGFFEEGEMWCPSCDQFEPSPRTHCSWRQKVVDGVRKTCESISKRGLHPKSRSHSHSVSPSAQCPSHARRIEQDAQSRASPCHSSDYEAVYPYELELHGPSNVSTIKPPEYHAALSHPQELPDTPVRTKLPLSTAAHSGFTTLSNTPLPQVSGHISTRSFYDLGNPSTASFGYSTKCLSSPEQSAVLTTPGGHYQALQNPTSYPQDHSSPQALQRYSRAPVRHHVPQQSSHAKSSDNSTINASAEWSNPSTTQLVAATGSYHVPFTRPTPLRLVRPDFPIAVRQSSVSSSSTLASSSSEEVELGDQYGSESLLEEIIGAERPGLSSTRTVDSKLMTSNAVSMWCSEPGCFFTPKEARDGEAKLKRHLTRKHRSSSIRYPCKQEDCQKSYTRQDNLRKHEKKKHPASCGAPEAKRRAETPAKIELGGTCNKRRRRDGDEQLELRAGWYDKLRMDQMSGH